MYLILLLFGLLSVFWSCFKSVRKNRCVVGASSSDLGDVVGCEEVAYDSEFVETVGGGD